MTVLLGQISGSDPVLIGSIGQSSALQQKLDHMSVRMTNPKTLTLSFTALFQIKRYKEFTHA
jgi:hypothetical protein